MARIPTVQHVPGAGACVVSRSVLEGLTPVRWLFREQPIADSDTGWRFLGLDDTQDYVNDPVNMTVTDWNAVATLEPAVIPTLGMPVGSDLQLVREDGRVRVVDNLTRTDVGFGE